MRESRIEKRLREGVEKQGGLAWKLFPISVKGIPDRLCLFPRGRVAFVELKAKDGRLGPLQRYWADKLIGLGMSYAILWSAEQVDTFLAKYENQK